MGQKVNPNCFRLGISNSWESLWYSEKRDYKIKLEQDIKVRNIVLKRFNFKNIDKILINRLIQSIVINIYTNKPGIIVGRKGTGIMIIKQNVARVIPNIKIIISVTEVRNIEFCASLISQSIAYQLNKKISFRKIAKNTISNTIKNNINGIKIMLKGRLGGVEIARSECFKKGKIPLHTIKFKIEYSLTEVKTSYGIIGIKVWIYKDYSISR